MFRWLVKSDGTKVLQYSMNMTAKLGNEIKLAWLNVNEVVETEDNNPFEVLYGYVTKKD